MVFFFLVTSRTVKTGFFSFLLATYTIVVVGDLCSIVVVGDLC